jgi:hypothetical protein
VLHPLLQPVQGYVGLACGKIGPHAVENVV